MKPALPISEATCFEVAVLLGEGMFQLLDLERQTLFGSGSKSFIEWCTEFGVNVRFLKELSLPLFDINLVNKRQLAMALKINEEIATEIINRRPYITMSSFITRNKDLLPQHLPSNRLFSHFGYEFVDKPTSFLRRFWPTMKAMVFANMRPKLERLPSNFHMNILQEENVFVVSRQESLFYDDDIEMLLNIFSEAAILPELRGEDGNTYIYHPTKIEIKFIDNGVDFQEHINEIGLKPLRSFTRNYGLASFVPNIKDPCHLFREIERILLSQNVEFTEPHVIIE